MQAQEAAAPEQASKARGDRPANITSRASSGTCSVPGYLSGICCRCWESLTASKVSQHAQHCSSTAQTRCLQTSLKASANTCMRAFPLMVY